MASELRDGSDVRLRIEIDAEGWEIFADLTQIE